MTVLSRQGCNNELDTGTAVVTHPVLRIPPMRASVAR